MNVRRVCRRTLGAALAAVIAMGLVVPAGPTALAADEPPTLWGSLQYKERGPGAAYDGIANAFIMGSFAPVAATRLGGAMQLLFDLLQNPALAEAMGTDLGSVSDELRRVAPAGRPPIKASYDALVSFQLEADRSGNTYHLKSGSISWSTDNITTFSAGDNILADDFHGQAVEQLDPSTDVVDLTFEDRGDGSIGWTLDVEVDHTYLTDGRSSWTSPIGAITLVRNGSKVDLGGTTPFGPVPIPPLPPDLFADQARTVSYTAIGTVPEIGDQILHTETWTNILEGTQVARFQARGDCSPVIVRPDPPRLVFDEGDPGTVRDTAVLQGPPFALEAATWKFPEVPFDADYQPADLKGPRVDFSWHKLPPRNDQFRAYTLAVEYTDPSVADACGPVPPLDLEVYFPIGAKNNPDGKDPNWFYYWMQTSARNGIDRVRVVKCEANTVGEYTQGDQYLRLCDPATYRSDARAADGAPIAFIDTFAVTLIHENRHRQNSDNWWGGGLKRACYDTDGDGRDNDTPDCVMDTDRDGVPDAEEPSQTAPDGHNLGLIVGDVYSCVLGPLTPANIKSMNITDEECTAYWEEIRWQIGSARSEDWAAPGSQWGDAVP